jgi:hypothetical protein
MLNISTLAEISLGTSPAQLARILSASIAPVIVISGVGLLLLSMTNRYSRVADLARDMIGGLETITSPSRHETLVRQVRITYRRARILRLAIIMASICILLVTFTVLSLFAGQVLGMGLDYFSVPCFGLSLVALLGSLYSFIQDVGISLTALELQTGPYIANPDSDLLYRLPATRLASTARSAPEPLLPASVPSRG